MDQLMNLGRIHPNLAYGYALVGNITLACMQILFKITSAYLTAFQLLAYRSVFLLLLSVATLRY
jgi:hypothetical protein